MSIGIAPFYKGRKSGCYGGESSLRAEEAPTQRTWLRDLKMLKTQQNRTTPIPRGKPGKGITFEMPIKKILRSPHKRNLYACLLIVVHACWFFRALSTSTSTDKVIPFLISYMQS